MKLEFSRHVFEKQSIIKFHQNSSSGSRVLLTCVLTDGHEGANSRVSQFFANPPKIVAYTFHLKYEITEYVSTMKKTVCVSTQSEFRPS